MAHVQSTHIKRMGVTDSDGQAVYHSIIGTHNEDLVVFQSITSIKSPWKLRSDLTGTFTSQNKVLRPIKLPKQIYYSKLAQANMTGLLTESAFQTANKQVFAGRRTKSHINSFQKLMRAENPSSLFSNSITSVTYLLKY